MAEEQEGAQQPELETLELEPGQEVAPEPEQEEDPKPLTVEALAEDLGWVPQDRFKGPADQWRPADEFLRRGREIQSEYRKEIQQMRQTLDTVSRTTSTIIEERLAAQKAELETRFQQAVEDGDPQAAARAAGELNRLQSQAPQPQLSPVVADFADRNASWFQKDAAATALAAATCDRLAAMGFDHAQQLEAAEKEVRRAYPDLFAEQRNGHAKPPPALSTSTSRSAAPAPRAKGYSDLPEAAKRIALDLEERGVIKGEGTTPARDIYARQFWAEQAKQQPAR